MTPALIARGLRPAAELAQDKPHGVRVRYIAGCRCDACRKANSSYESARQKARAGGDWNGIVDAAPARAHLLKLAKAGIGRRAVSAATDLPESIIFTIRNGSRKRIRARTLRKILAVDKSCASDRALMHATRSLQLLDELIEEGYTKTYLAKRLGYKTRALQFKAGLITVRNAARIERLHKELTT